MCSTWVHSKQFEMRSFLQFQHDRLVYDAAALSAPNGLCTLWMGRKASPWYFSWACKNSTTSCPFKLVYTALLSYTVYARQQNSRSAIILMNSTLLSYTVYARQRNSRSAIILVNSRFFVSLPKGYFFLSQRGRRSKWSLGRFTKAKPISFRLSAVVVKMVTRPQPNLLIWATREKRPPKR